MRAKRVIGWRRIAGAIWSSANDPEIFGLTELDATAIERFIAKARAAGHPLTVTHVVGRAVAQALREVPALPPIEPFDRVAPVEPAPFLGPL